MRPGVNIPALERELGPLAQRLALHIAAATGVEAPVGILDITLYRDDIGAHPVPQVGPTRIAFPITGRPVVLVDDVLYTGRTIRAVVNELFDFGRPASVTLAVLVDRGARELPIAAAFAAARIAVPASQRLRLARADDGGFSFAVTENR